MRSSAICFAILFLIFMPSCSKVPSGVIPPDKMAEVIADLNVGEAVVEVNRADYREDSLKYMMIQSVLDKHDITQADLDSSYNWYGRNISVYMEVCDKTIELIEKRIAETGNRIAAENISIAGDSVDIWSSARFIGFNSLSPSRMMTFNITNDENWERGDSYTWRAKFTNNDGGSLWAIVADYEDGSKEMLTSDLAGDGWKEINFISDSTRIPTRVYGYMNIRPKGVTTLWADSIMLVRNRLNPEKYNRRYRQTVIKPKNSRDTDTGGAEADKE